MHSRFGIAVPWLIVEYPALMPTAMRLTELCIPLLRPLSNARGAVGERRIVLVSITEDGLTGWGEAAPYPGVTIETVADVWNALQSNGRPAPAGHTRGLPPSARAAIDQARKDLEARRAGVPLWTFVGGTPRSIRACAAIGLKRTPAETVEHVNQAVEAGILEVKIKIAPGQDLPHLQAVRRQFPGLAISADANGSYQMGDPIFEAVDTLSLSYLEQPLDGDDLGGHQQLRSRIDTPLCLDESVTTPDRATRVIERRCADMVSLKPGLLGTSSVLRIAERAREAGIDVKVGGLVETSVGRSHALAIASLEGVKFTDLVPTRWMLAADVSDHPWDLAAGHHTLPEDPGLGIRVDPFSGTASDHVVRSELVTP